MGLDEAHLSVFHSQYSTLFFDLEILSGVGDLWCIGEKYRICLDELISEAERTVEDKNKVLPSKPLLSLLPEVNNEVNGDETPSPIPLKDHGDDTDEYDSALSPLSLKSKRKKIEKFPIRTAAADKITLKNNPKIEESQFENVTMKNNMRIRLSPTRFEVYIKENEPLIKKITNVGVAQHLVVVTTSCSHLKTVHGSDTMLPPSRRVQPLDQPTKAPVFKTDLQNSKILTEKKKKCKKRRRKPYYTMPIELPTNAGMKQAISLVNEVNKGDGPHFYADSSLQTSPSTSAPYPHRQQLMRQQQHTPHSQSEPTKLMTIKDGQQKIPLRQQLMRQQQHTPISLFEPTKLMTINDGQQETPLRQQLTRQHQHT
ncbi:unnamed protein product [Mytilus coruscus]|uniref:Uncharacterized protein n=1 Tax=Mytilus coruscus TaxID=42192 RepID=A0A6J8A5Z9_MYTCO|nr:unnamed protein product [Mytilus coruscus]